MRTSCLAFRKLFSAFAIVPDQRNAPAPAGPKRTPQPGDQITSKIYLLNFDSLMGAVAAPAGYTGPSRRLRSPRASLHRWNNGFNEEGDSQVSLR